MIDDMQVYIANLGKYNEGELYYLIDEVQALGEIPSSLQNYIDYEAYGRDLDIEGTFIATNAGICEVLR